MPTYQPFQRRQVARRRLVGRDDEAEAGAARAEVAERRKQDAFVGQPRGARQDDRRSAAGGRSAA